MSDPQPIETCPEGEWVLVWRGYTEQWVPDRFRWFEEGTDEVQSVTKHGAMTRRIIHTTWTKVRDWENNSGAEWWLPMPPPPPTLSQTRREKNEETEG